MAKTKKSTKSTKSSSFLGKGEKTSFVRDVILTNPQVKPQEVKDKWLAAKMPEKDAPKDAFTYGLKNAMAKRWGIKNLAEIPRKKNGQINMTGLMFVFMGRNPDITHEEMNKILGRNGLTVKMTNFSVAKSAFKKKTSLAGSAEVPVNDLVPQGPRARKLVKGKKYGKRKKSPDEMTDQERTSVFYQGLERQLDDMIRMADNVKDSKLVEALRVGRRVASAKILQLV